MSTFSFGSVDSLSISFSSLRCCFSSLVVLAGKIFSSNYVGRDELLIVVCLKKTFLNLLAEPEVYLRATPKCSNSNLQKLTVKRRLLLLNRESKGTRKEGWVCLRQMLLHAKYGLKGGSFCAKGKSADLP